MEIPSEQRNDVSTLSDQKGQSQIDQKHVGTDRFDKPESSIAPGHKLGETDEGNEAVCNEIILIPTVEDYYTMINKEVQLIL